MIFIKRLKLTLGLQNDTGRDLTTADCGNQAFEAWDLTDIGELIQETAHMDGQPATINVIGLITKQIEQLSVEQGSDKIEGIISVTDDHKERR